MSTDETRLFPVLDQGRTYIFYYVVRMEALSGPECILLLLIADLALGSGISHAQFVVPRLA